MARATIQASNVHGSNGGEVTAVRERGVAAKKKTKKTWRKKYVRIYYNRYMQIFNLVPLT